jgi:glycine cleavage system aminomethyltransferase T
VARHLRWIFLGDVPPPESGTELYDAQGEKAVGRITSACPSPRFGETLAMGYVHRSVEPGGRVRLGNPEGTEGLVRELGDR